MSAMVRRDYHAAPGRASSEEELVGRMPRRSGARTIIHAIEAAGQTWHIAYTSPNLPGIQAAVSVGQHPA